MTYDRIDWHAGNNFPKELPPENGGIHTGMFITWIIENNLIGLLHKEHSKDSIKKVKNKEMTGTQFLVKECDSKFWDEDLNDEGNRFANFYYANKDGYGLYVDDYSIVFNNYETLYHVEDNWSNYTKIQTIITNRYKQWQENN